MNGEMQIFYSKTKLALLSLLGVLLIIGSAAMAFRWYPGIKPGSFEEFVGYCGVVFFGLPLVVTVKRFFSSDAPAITLSPDGLLDTRIANASIPWTAIRNIAVATMNGQSFIVIDVEPKVEAALPLTRTARWSRGPNRALGIDGLCITATGLRTNHDDLLRAIGERWMAANGAHAA